LLPPCASIRFSRKGTEPEVYFRIIYITPVCASNSAEKIEQPVEIALGPKGAFENHNVGTIVREIRSDQIVSAVSPRSRNKKPPKELKIPRVKLLLQKAIEWNRQLETGEAASQAEIARRENLTRGRVTQILNLGHLDPEIQEYILSMPDSKRQPVVTERALRPIAIIDNHKEQKSIFSNLLSL